MRMVLRRGVEPAASHGASLVREHLVRYALLNVVGFAREDQQRFVLRLPPEPGDAAVVACPVCVSADAERFRHSLIGRNRAVGYGFDQAQPEGRRRNAEFQIAVGELQEILLPERTSWRVGASLDCEYSDDSATARDTSHFAHRPVEV